jgi:hypothetical protein
VVIHEHLPLIILLLQAVVAVANLHLVVAVVLVVCAAQ